MTASRVCGARGCGKPLVKRKKELSWQFNRRSTCGHECACVIRADAQYAARALEALNDETPNRVHPLLQAWDDSVRCNPPSGPRRWWR